MGTVGEESAEHLRLGKDVPNKKLPGNDLRATCPKSTFFLFFQSLSHKKVACSFELCSASYEEGELNFSLAHLNQVLSAQHDNRVRNPNSAPGLECTATPLT